MNPRCQSCGVEMEEGFVAALGSDETAPAAWIEGQPKRNWLGSVQKRGRASFPLTTYRCPRCGQLAVYALPARPADSPHQLLTERVGRMEDELARLAERERFLLELLRTRGVEPNRALPPGLPEGEGGPPRGGPTGPPHEE